MFLTPVSRRVGGDGLEDKDGGTSAWFRIPFVIRVPQVSAFPSNFPAQHYFFSIDARPVDQLQKHEI
jgi:hypothetical protein